MPKDLKAVFSTQELEAIIYNLAGFMICQDYSISEVMEQACVTKEYNKSTEQIAVLKAIILG